MRLGYRKINYMDSGIRKKYDGGDFICNEVGVEIFYMWMNDLLIDDCSKVSLK